MAARGNEFFASWRRAAAANLRLRGAATPHRTLEARGGWEGGGAEPQQAANTYTKIFKLPEAYPQAEAPAYFGSGQLRLHLGQESGRTRGAGQRSVRGAPPVGRPT
eukprot:GHVT01084427.1.p1 GENE.GHVT01084427.1~~GHVT01084427.1.p1  ORF type:complete len:120 (+),score=27.66 GHVT01084427.1:45-362(+)